MMEISTCTSSREQLSRSQLLVYLRRTLYSSLRTRLLTLSEIRAAIGQAFCDTSLVVPLPLAVSELSKCITAMYIGLTVSQKGELRDGPVTSLGQHAEVAK